MATTATAIINSTSVKPRQGNVPLRWHVVACMERARSVRAGIGDEEMRKLRMRCIGMAGPGVEFATTTSQDLCRMPDAPASRPTSGGLWGTRRKFRHAIERHAKRQRVV